MTEELTFPVIHSNGSDETRLRRQYNKLFCALSDAKMKLDHEIDFHQRDYYPLGEDAWYKALEERNEMIKCLAKVYQYARSHMYSLGVKYPHDKDLAHCELDYGKDPLPYED